MRYVASTQIGSLFLSSIHAASRRENVSPPLANRVMQHASEAVEAFESGTYPEFQHADHAMSVLFLQWASALKSGDGKKAIACAAQIDALAADHPFTYAETKEIFSQYYSYSSYSQALQNYRPWDGSDPNFAVIEHSIPGDATVAVFGDWGTGTDDAKDLFRALMMHDPDVILHLGDIYQAGMPLEIEEFFLEPINAVCAELGKTRPPIFTIPGNHEYFSGGAGFFELIDVLNQGIDETWAQPASFFCLRSDDGKWQFLGGDTGITCIDNPAIPGLEPAELTWHRARIAEFSGKTVFMTHHQFVSADAGIYHNRPRGVPYDYRYFNPNLVAAFAQDIPGQSGTYLDRIDLWLWGHDHWFIPYAQNLNIPIGGASSPVLRRGQLLGGSARETTVNSRSIKHSLRDWVEQADGQPVLPDATPTADGTDAIYNHTYGILKLATGKMTYYQSPAWEAGRIYPLGQPIRNPLLVQDI